MSHTIAQRLVRCMDAGALSVADLAVWMNVAYPTMRAWVQGRVPRSARARQLELSLAKLERAIDRGTGLPVPMELSQHKRPAYMGALRAKILGPHLAARRARSSLRSGLLSKIQET